MTFDDFYSKYKTVPHFVANKYKDRGIEYDDLVQLALIGMYKSFGTIEKAQNELSYIINGAKNEIFREFKDMNTQKRSGQTVSIDKERLNGKNMLDLLGVDAGIASYIEFKVTIKDLCKLIDEDITTVIQMKVDGYTLDEIAEHMNYPNRHTVDRKMKNFRRKLKEVYTL